MDTPFREIAEALDDLRRWERHRLDFVREAGLRGQVEPWPDLLLAGWAQRLNRLEAATALLTALIPHEAAVRALDVSLHQDAGQRPDAPPPPPTLWPEPGAPRR